MIQKILTLILFTSFVSLANGQFAIIGQNGETPDELLVVALEDVPAGEVFHFTDNEYSHSTDAFTSGEGFVTFSSVALVPEGIVFSIKNDSGWTIEGSAGLLVDSNSGSLNISFGNEQTYIYQTTDNLSSGTISKVITALDNWDGEMPAEINPIVNHPSSSVCDLPLNIRNATYTGSRELINIEDVTDLDNWTFSENRIDLDLTDFENSIIPVELSLFNGRNLTDGNFLFWETSSEVDNDIFVIERSDDGKHFEEIDFIVGSGTSFSINKYDYTDQSPSNGLNYYRLKQIDFNGNFTFSKTIVLENRIDEDFNIYPTVVSDYITLETNNIEDGEIAVFDETGRVVLMNDLQSFNNTIECSSLVSGAYYMVLYSNNTSYAKKFIKQ
jgi:hypothetical protein